MADGHRAGVPPRARAARRRRSEEQEDLDRALGRLGSFLALIGTFALLLGGIGVASAMGAYMAQKRDTVATLRCLGATAPQVIVIYLLQAVAMGLIGAALGTVIGLAVQWVLPRLLADLLPVEVETALSWPAVATGDRRRRVDRGGVRARCRCSPRGASRPCRPSAGGWRRTRRPGGTRWTIGGWALLAASIVALILFQAGEVRTGLGFAAAWRGRCSRSGPPPGW